MSIKDKLARLRPQLVHEAARTAAAAAQDTAAPVRPSDAASQVQPISHQDKWSRFQTAPAVFADACVMVREVRYPLTHRHGQYAFSQFADILALWNNPELRHPLSGAGTAPEDWLFFDTETTGLNGGTGNAIFLLGYCRVQPDAVVVRQHFLPSPAAERALYQSFIQDIGGAKRLVTFNGKSFDWPQVKTRLTLLGGAAPEMPSFIHHDLMHAARRLWRDDLPSCRLSVIEEAKLGVRRGQDTPGHMAPLLYFEYLRSGDPDAVAGVLRHNELDVLSLVTLYIHLSRLVQRFWQQAATTIPERMQLSRWYEALGQDDCAIVGYQSVAQSGHALSTEAKFALGYVLKRRKQWARALAAWEECLRELPHIPEELYVELAKLCEHGLRDYEKALHYARRASAAHSRKEAMLRRTAHRRHFESHGPEARDTKFHGPGSHERRLARLERKLQRAAPHENGE